MRQLDRATWLWVGKYLVLCYLITAGLLLLFAAPLDNFLATRFPDPGTDDLSLPYVIRNFPPVGIVFITAMFVSALLGFRLKRCAYLGVAILFANISFFILMRSNFEFYYWMISVPQPGYGGLAAVMTTALTLGLAIAWLVADNLLFYLEQRNKGQAFLIKKISSVTTFAGIALSLLISWSNFGPAVVHVIKNGW